MLNVICVMGRLVADPVMRQTPGGKNVASFRIAVDGAKKDAPANFFEVVAWERTAEFVSKYFQKGSLIAISGQLQSRQYQDKSGNKRTAVEIVARDVSFCESKTTRPTPETPVATIPSRQSGEAAYSQGNENEFAEINDGDDLPF